MSPDRASHGAATADVCLAIAVDVGESDLSADLLRAMEA
jgi:hypothetical protein